MLIELAPLSASAPQQRGLVSALPFRTAHSCHMQAGTSLLDVQISSTSASYEPYLVTTSSCHRGSTSTFVLVLRTYDTGRLQHNAHLYVASTLMQINKLLSPRLRTLEAVGLMMRDN